jgi:WD40 repeat protein
VLTCVTFTPDGDYLVAGALNQGGLAPAPTVLVWEVKTGKQVMGLSRAGGVLAVAVSPDGKTIASAGGDFLARVWDFDTKKEKLTLRGHSHMVSGVGFTPDGRRIITGSYDGTLRVWDAATGSLVRTLRGHTAAVSGLALPADGQYLATASADGTVRLWSWDRDQEALTRTESLGACLSLAFHPDGRHLAFRCNGVSLWDLNSGKVARTYKEFVVNFNTTAVAFSRDGERLAAGSMVVKAWDTASGKKLFGKDPPLTGNKDPDVQEAGIIFGMAYSPDGDFIATAGDGVQIWDAATGKRLRRMGAERMRALTVAYSPAGKQLASGGADGVVTLWDAASGEAVRTFPRLPDAVLKVSFTADGRRLLAAGDSEVRAWELPAGQEIPPFRLASTRTPARMGAVRPERISFTADGPRPRCAGDRPKGRGRAAGSV